MIKPHFMSSMTESIVLDSTTTTRFCLILFVMTYSHNCKNNLRYTGYTLVTDITPLYDVIALPTETAINLSNG